MSQAQRCGRASAPERRQRELIDDRSFEARERAFAHALAVKVPEHVRVTADFREAAERGQQAVAIGRELVVIDDGDSLPKAFLELYRLSNARDVGRARLL